MKPSPPPGFFAPPVLRDPATPSGPGPTPAPAPLPLPPSSKVDLRSGLSLFPSTGQPTILNRWLDDMPTIITDFFPKRIHPYLGCGVAGIVFGLITAAAAALWVGLPLLTLATCATASLASFVVLGTVRLRVMGREQHVLLQDLLAAFASTTVVAFATHVSVAKSLDVMTVGLGVFLGFGRLGCWASGCCHGRPARVGTRYGARSRVEQLLFGIRLFPVQLVETIWIFVATAGALLWLGMQAPGLMAWTWFLLSYCCLRFVLEFLRGDKDRRFFGPLSEAQWTTLALLVVVLIGWDIQRAYDDPPKMWRLGAQVVAMVGAVVVAWRLRKRWFIWRRSEVRPDTVSRWRLRLSELHHAAASGATEHARFVFSPDDLWRIFLTDDPADQGLRLWSYTLKPGPAWSDGRADIGNLVPALLDAAGMILQGLPPHQVLRFSRSGVGDGELWVLVDTNQNAVVTPHDSARQICHRAEAFADALRL